MENTLCTGCLCSDRKLYFIGETGFYQLYLQILNEIPVQDMSQVSIRVCWECCALLHKFQLFKARVKQNYLDLLWSTNIPTSHPTRLTSKQVYNISYPDKECELKDVLVKEECMLPDDIKTETDNDQSEHMEPASFVNDLLVEREENKPTKKSKKGPKQKKPSKNKIKVKKKKKTKEAVQSDGISDIDLLEDGVLDDVEDTADEKKEEVKKMDVDILVEISSEVLRPKYNIPVLPIPAPLSKVLKKPLVKPLPKSSADILPEKPECVECGKTFSSRKTYRYHLNVLHKGNNRYPCPRCGKIYQWKSNLGRHMRTHKAVDAGELYCDTCDKSFASVATYRQHLRISRRHVSENEFGFTCNECGKKFVNKTRLRDHIDWEHLKKIKFRCQLCNKPFKCHTSLYVHLQNVHRNKEKKDNLCHVCGKSYQNAAKLKYHIIALHTGETPYQCSQCTAAFGWYSSLYRHVREVHYKVKNQPKKTKKTKKLESEPPVYMNYHHP